MIMTHFSSFCTQYRSFHSFQMISEGLLLVSKSITCDLSELPHQQFCGWGNEYLRCSKSKALGQSWRWCVYRSKVPLTDGEYCVRVPCKAELVRAMLQISVGIAPPYLIRKTKIYGNIWKERGRVTSAQWNAPGLLSKFVRPILPLIGHTLCHGKWTRPWDARSCRFWTDDMVQLCVDRSSADDASTSSGCWFSHLWM